MGTEQGSLYIDCTVGLGGHSEAILESSDSSRVIGIDLDEEALSYASARLERFGKRFRPVHANFREIDSILEGGDKNEVCGVLVDLGVSSLQFDSSERGFSFRFDAPLDMRDATSDVETAADLLRRLPEDDSKDTF